jgi:hypothetical protein
MCMLGWFATFTFPRKQRHIFDYPSEAWEFVNMILARAYNCNSVHIPVRVLPKTAALIRVKFNKIDIPNIKGFNLVTVLQSFFEVVVEPCVQRQITRASFGTWNIERTMNELSWLPDSSCENIPRISMYVLNIACMVFDSDNNWWQRLEQWQGTKRKKQSGRLFSLGSQL